MQRFYFDIRDGHEFAKDEEGLMLTGVDAAVSEAKRSLGDITHEVLRDGTHTGTLSIEIRNDNELIGSVGLTYSVQMQHASLS